MRLVAITGSIGCGKSTLADLLRKLGYLVYNVDGWTGNLYRNENFCKLILNDFPEVNDNGKVNKKFLRKIVFDDAEKFMSLGAERLGTSRLVKIMKNAENGVGY